MIKVNDAVINPRFFPDGTFNLTELGKQFSDIEFGYAWAKDYYKIKWYWEDPSEYMLLYFITNHLYDRCGCKIDLFMPYIPDARMDRVKHPFSELFTLKYFAKFINNLGFNEVHVLDPHSNVAAALIDRIVIHEPSKIVKTIVDDNEINVLCFPDEGAMKRYSDKCNFRPYIYGEKKRNWKTGNIEGVILHNPYDVDLKDKHILIVDDICSKGGTFFHTGRAIREFYPSQIDLFVSHCEQSVFDGQLLKPGVGSPINTIYTTNSLKRDEHFFIKTIKVFE